MSSPCSGSAEFGSASIARDWPALADYFRSRGKKVVIVHSGHNIDRNTLRWALGLFDALAHV